jgi:hypothetical protein
MLGYYDMRLFFSGVGLLLSWSLFVTAHLYFLQLFLYWHLAWLDILMHTWGGMLLIASWYELRRLELFRTLANRVRLHPLIFLGVVMIGWEVFKYLIADTLSQNYELDTVIDLGSGLFGGLIIFYWFRHRQIK